MTRSEPGIRAARLALGYGSERVLRDVALEIRPREFWLVVGPNGAGKSTLLRALLGELPPAAGELRVRPDWAGGKRTAFVPQRSAFGASLPTTVREFVLLGLAGLRVRRSLSRARLAAALSHVGLEGREAADYRSLSGGQRQRALVARALVREPELLVLDEPTIGLDLAAEGRFLEILRHLHRDEGLTVILVTHDLRIAARHATHVALLHDGGVESGPCEQILTPERLERAYGVPVRVE